MISSERSRRSLIRQRLGWGAAAPPASSAGGAVVFAGVIAVTVTPCSLAGAVLRADAVVERAQLIAAGLAPVVHGVGPRRDRLAPELHVGDRVDHQLAQRGEPGRLADVHA